MQTVQNWVMTVCCGAAVCGVVSALVPGESGRRAMDVVLGMFMLCCFIMPAGAAFSSLDISFDTGDAEQSRQEAADELGGYFFRSAAGLSEAEILQNVEELLAPYGLNSGEAQIYIITDEGDDGLEVTAELHLPERMSRYHSELHKLLEYELGVTVRLEYGEVEDGKE